MYNPVVLISKNRVAALLDKVGYKSRKIKVVVTTEVNFPLIQSSVYGLNVIWVKTNMDGGEIHRFTKDDEWKTVRVEQGEVFFRWVVYNTEEGVKVSKVRIILNHKDFSPFLQLYK